jgi:hypothetical protein
MDEDQYDFHAYCLRKQTLNAYIECVNKNASSLLFLSARIAVFFEHLAKGNRTACSLVRFEDHLRDHPRFAAASKNAVEVRLDQSPFDVPLQELTPQFYSPDLLPDSRLARVDQAAC